MKSAVRWFIGGCDSGVIISAIFISPGASASEWIQGAQAEMLACIVLAILVRE